MRWASRIAAVLVVLVLLPSVSTSPDCRCIDPPTDMTVTLHTTLTTVDIGRDHYDDLEDSLDTGELVFIIETVPLGACSHCARTFVKYLTGFDIEAREDEYGNLSVPINAVIYSITECWPPSRVSFTATLFEDDYSSYAEVHDIVRRLAANSADGVPIPELSEEDARSGWTLLLSGAWLTRLSSAIEGGKDVIGRVTTWQRSFPTEQGPHRNFPDEIENTLIYGRTDRAGGTILWQLHHDYGYPPGRCTGEEVANIPPRARASCPTYSPGEPPSDIHWVGETITFRASGSSDEDGEIVSFTWDMGDGNTAEGDRVRYAYDDAGTYEVCVTVTDDDGATDTDCCSVEILMKEGG
jgi:hypothetical protein